MTLKQILQTNTWSTILPVFLKTYPEAEENIKGYQTVFEKLVIMSPEENDMSIVITKEKDGEDEYIDVSGVHKNPKNEEGTYSQAIEFTPWREWLGMDINKETSNDFSGLEIIVHCLYEMTFVGFTEEVIQEKINRIEKSRKERESMTKAERDATAISAEELFKEWLDENND
ncbi:MAG: DUF6557 family protein [Gelidibacter sp.]|uniref:DUF6557 family protein n=1 Tax=Gelidibacter sp. TaxID=2018083 RepID=UPI00326470EA